MRSRIATAFAFGLLLSAATAVRGGDDKIMSTFDVDLEGWRAQGGRSAHEVRDDAQGGYFQISDLDSTNMLVIAPEQFVGDLSRFDGGMLSFDVREISAPDGRAWPGFGLLTIVGGGCEVRADIAPHPATRTWKTYSIPLIASDWQAEPTAWARILSDVKSIMVTLESSSPQVETVGFDNFRLSTRPDMISSEEFQQRDLNGDGRLNVDEFPKRLRGYWKYIDTNQDGWVDRSEAKRDRTAIPDEEVS